MVVVCLLLVVGVGFLWVCGEGLDTSSFYPVHLSASQADI